ncbi:MAG: hypothetical protein M3P87_05585 [Actinomycetota bacterium]|nr:hypothetical protein [Actinomycetota bacterium]
MIRRSVVTKGTVTTSQEKAAVRPAAKNPVLWVLVPVWALVVAVSVVFALRLGTSVFTVADIGWAILQGAMISTGVIILANRPGNVVGRFLLASGLIFSLGWLLFIPTVILLENRDVAGAGLAEAASNAAASLWMPFLLAAFIYFPDGMLPSQRWRWVRALLWVTGSLAVLAPLTNGGWGGDEATAVTENPLRDVLHPLGEITAGAFGVALIFTTLTACGAVIVRFRRSEGITRQQMKWLAYAALLQIIWFPIELAISRSVASTGLVGAIGSLVITLALAAIAIAVLRYRLYEVDRIISRTVSYTLVVALLLGIFFGSVALLTSFLPTDSSLAVAGSTLAVAALFNPARRRIQDWVDRRFNRSRYQSQQVVDRFTVQLRDQTNFDQLTSGLTNVVQETLHPVRLGIWISERS